MKQQPKTVAIALPIMLGLQQVADTLSLSKSSIHNLVASGAFPRPRKLTAKRVAWLTSDVLAWASSLPESDHLPPPNTGAPKPRTKAGPVGYA
jgi:prophage regulatory protein